MTKYGIDPKVICQINDLANNRWINSVLCHHTNSFDKPSSSLTILVIISQNNYTIKRCIHKQYFDACVPEAGIDRYNKKRARSLEKGGCALCFLSLALFRRHISWNKLSQSRFAICQITRCAVVTAAMSSFVAKPRVLTT